MSTHVGSGPIAVEPIEKFHHSDLVRLDRTTVLQFGDQPRAFDLRLPLSAGEAMPTAPALAGHRIMTIEDDCPTAGRALTDMAAHYFFSLCFCFRRATNAG